jgi:hypothetical protein
MKTEIINLGSVVKNGVEGPENGAINLIYSYLLQENGLNFYNRIKINQIGDDLEELIMREYKKIHISIRYPADPDYDNKKVSEKNNIRLNIIHAALLRLANFDKRLDVDKLETIRSKILENNFAFDIPYKSFVNPKQKNQVAKIIIQPHEHTFAFYAIIEEAGKEKCKILLYNGKTTDYYITAFFSYGKWRGINSIVISGKYKEAEMHVDVNKCSVDIVNFSKYEKPPFFEMMKSDNSEEEKRSARKNWLDSLPPGMADFLRENGA